MFTPELLRHIEATKEVEQQFKAHGKQVHYVDQYGKVTVLVWGDKILVESQMVVTNDENRRKVAKS